MVHFIGEVCELGFYLAYVCFYFVYFLFEPDVPLVLAVCRAWGSAPSSSACVVIVMSLLCSCIQVLILLGEVNV